MKEKSLWKGLIVMLAAAFVMLVTPIQKVSAQDQVLNGTETLNWSSSYSGKMYGMDECYKYAFSIPSSGKVAFTINTVDSGCMGTGIDEVQILDASGTEIYTESIGEGLSTVSADLLAGNYTLRLCAGFWTGCRFSFISAFQPSGETKTESASKIPTTTITKVKNVKTYSYYKQISVSFKRKSYVDGYQIQVARDKKFKKGKKTITCDSIYNKEIVTGLKKGTYYVRIRPYVTARKTNNYTSIYKNYYASWSKVKSVKVK